MCFNCLPPFHGCFVPLFFGFHSPDFCPISLSMSSPGCRHRATLFFFCPCVSACPTPGDRRLLSCFSVNTFFFVGPERLTRFFFLCDVGWGNCRFYRPHALVWGKKTSPLRSSPLGLRVLFSSPFYRVLSLGRASSSILVIDK